jgi:hypothetical protein
MGFDPSLLPLKREENWIATGLRSLLEEVGEGRTLLKNGENWSAIAFFLNWEEAIACR